MTPTGARPPTHNEVAITGPVGPTLYHALVWALSILFTNSDVFR